MGNLSGCDDPTIHLQHAGTTFRDTGAVVGELEPDRMLARGECLFALPAEVLERQEVVVEQRLALEQVETVAAGTPP
jgi:hypothetical protein